MLKEDELFEPDWPGGTQIAQRCRIFGTFLVDSQKTNSGLPPVSGYSLRWSQAV